MRFAPEIILHDLPERKILQKISAHKGILSGLTFAGEERLLSCGIDKTVKMWGVEDDGQAQDGVEVDENGAGPSTPRMAAKSGQAMVVFHGKYPFRWVLVSL